MLVALRALYADASGQTPHLMKQFFQTDKISAANLRYILHLRGFIVLLETFPPPDLRHDQKEKRQS